MIGREYELLPSLGGNTSAFSITGLPSYVSLLGFSRKATVVVQGNLTGTIRSTTSLSCLLGSKGQVRGSSAVVKIV